MPLYQKTLHILYLPLRVSSLNVFCTVCRDYFPVGISLNARPLSALGSCGKPRTRSAIMFFKISSVPPAIRSPADPSHALWKSWTSETSVFNMPAMSSESIPKFPMACNLLALTTLVMEASGPGVSPLESADIVLSLVFLSPLA